MYRTQGPDATAVSVRNLYTDLVAQSDYLQTASGIFGGLQSDWTTDMHCTRPHAPGLVQSRAPVTRNRHGLHWMAHSSRSSCSLWTEGTTSSTVGRARSTTMWRDDRHGNQPTGGSMNSPRNVTPHQQDQGRHSSACHPTKTSHPIDPMVDLPAMRRPRHLLLMLHVFLLQAHLAIHQSPHPHQCRRESKHSARPRR